MPTQRPLFPCIFPQAHGRARPPRVRPPRARPHLPAAMSGKEGDGGKEGVVGVIQEPGKRRSRRSKGAPLWKTFVARTLKTVHPGLQMAPKTQSILNSLVDDIFERIVLESTRLVRFTRKRTLTSKEIRTVTKLMMSGDLRRHGVLEGNRAVQKYSDYYSKAMKKFAEAK